MNIIKRTLATILMTAALLLLIALPARADIGTQSFGVTNTFAANATTTANMGSAVKVDNQDNVGILLRYQGDAAGTDAVTVTFARSIDGTTKETVPRFTMVGALNGTTAVVYYTNLSTTMIGAAGYLHVVSVANASATVNATNCSITVIKKNLPR